MNYRELTRQELFDITWNGAKSTNFERSANSIGDCVYFSENGNRCAAGWHIPKRSCVTYNNGCEAFEVPFFKRNFDEWQIEMLCDLQRCHDQATDALDYRENLMNYSRERGYTIPEEIFLSTDE